MPKLTAANMLFTGVLLFFAAGCADDEKKFDRKPFRRTVEGNGIQSVFYLSPVNTAARYEFAPAATRFKRYEEVWFHSFISNTTDRDVKCPLADLDSPAYHGYQWLRGDEILAEGDGASEPELHVMSIALDDFVIHGRWSSQESIGIHEWPKVQEKHLQLSPGRYTAVAGTGLPFCTGQAGDLIIPFEVVEE